MLNLIGFRICANSTFKNQLVTFRYIYSDLMVLQSKKIRGESSRRNYIIYHSLFNKKPERNVSDEEKRTDLKKKIGERQKISIIQPNNEEMIMSMKDAEVYAKRLNMKLVQDENSRGDKKKYKLVKVSQLFDNKTNSRDTKRVFFRQEIDTHDLNVKLRVYLKMVLKGNKVICIVDGRDKNKLDGIIKAVEQNEINNYLTNLSKTSTGLNLIFEATKKNPAVNKSEDELKAL